MKQNVRTMVGKVIGHSRLSMAKRYGSVYKKRIERKVRNIINKEDCRVNLPNMQKIKPEGQHVWFGYYDKTPFNESNILVLTMSGPIYNYVTGTRDLVSVGYFNIKEGKYMRVGETNTWSWQLGCRLQWQPKEGNRWVMYNKIVEGRYGSVIQDVVSLETVAVYSAPIYDVSADGKSALFVNFSRLNRYQPGYGYENVRDPSVEESCPQSDGIWRLDLDTGIVELIISYKEIAEMQPRENMLNASHNVNHLSFNPAGDRFMFIHYWFKDGSRYSRLCTAARDGTSVCVLANVDYVGHYDWKTNDYLLVYADHKDTGPDYYLYQDVVGRRIKTGIRKVSENGHQSFCPVNTDLLVIDTKIKYDPYGDRYLFLYDHVSGKKIQIGPFFSPPKFRGRNRCDLHPRWDRIGKYVCFDSTHDGTRAMYVLEAGGILKEF